MDGADTKPGAVVASPCTRCMAAMEDFILASNNWTMSARWVNLDA